MTNPILTPTSSGLESPEAIIAAYQSNCGYDLESSVTKCKAFIVACRKMLANPVAFNRGGSQGHALQFDVSHVASEKQKAEAWLASKSGDNSAGGSGSRMDYVNFSEFRD